VTRQPAPGAEGALASPRFLEALFQPESLQSKRNTEAVEIATSTLAAGRVTAYQPAMTLPLDQAQGKARTLYLASKSAELAREEGVAKLAAWKENAGAASGLGQPVIVSREQPQGQARAIVDAALHAPVDGLPAWVGVNLGPDGYAVLKVNRIVPREGVDDARQTMERQQYERTWSTAEALAYYEVLKQNFKVQIKAPRPSANPSE